MSNGKNKKEGFSQVYYKHPVLVSVLIGGLVGYFVLSPITMVFEHLTHTDLETLGEHLRELLLLELIPWSAIFTFLGMGIGLMYGILQKRIRELEAGLFQTEKLASVGQLAAGIAHEINTPLSNISLITDKLKMKVKDKDKMFAEDLDEISGQVDNASYIINDLLDFSRTSEMEFVEVNVNELISHTLSFLKTKRKENVVVVEKYKDGVPLIMGEPNQLQQVFMNILSNAYDAMPDGGLLEITTSIKNNEYIEIRFKDNGKGISMEIFSRIFDPFFTTKQHGKGTGLGLSICHGIIQNHKGRIEVDSKIKVGTIFTIILPR